MNRSRQQATCLLSLILCVSFWTPASATFVRFDTNLGTIDVRLFDSATPASVANFLNYVNDGDYVDSFIHRAPPNFVIQGGGFTFPAGGNLGSVPTDSPVVNEPGLTNIRGTLAYAKQGGDPNSATSGWFFSTSDNSSNLDAQNGGFTVFGSVIGNGLQTVDTIASQQLANAGGAFTQLPVLDTFEPPTIQQADLILVNSVTVLNFDTADYNLDGVINTADFALWQSQFGSSLQIANPSHIGNSALVDADGTGDGVVSASDYVLLRDSFSPQTAVAPSFGVPEPTTLASLATMLLLATSRRRRH